MEVYLIRHTRVAVADDICYGDSDVDIASSFDKEVESLKEKVQFSPETIFYSSPKKRCLVLARKLTQSPILTDARIKELNFGDWELKKWNTIDKKDFHDWEKHIRSKRCPHGESYLDLYNRSVDFYKDMISRQQEQVCVITHGGVIRAILSYLLKIPLDYTFRLQVDFGKTTKLTIGKTKNRAEIVTIHYLNL